MCGLIGFSRCAGIDAAQVAYGMRDSIRHRGPDAGGTWFNDEDSIVLGHQRLAVLDTSQMGHQPMLSACGRYVIAYNGEIYNHLDLRSVLNKDKGIAWRGHSDTETLLACLSTWGVHETLRALVGMFAFALWDKQDKVLTLARDRLGEKPLYWGWSGNVLLFASELKALKRHPKFSAQVDTMALALLLRHGYIPAPHSIYKGIEKLLPGHLIQIPIQGNADLSKAAKPGRYWSLSMTAGHGSDAYFCGSPADATNILEKQLSISIAGQMISDVPLGAFLSGGVDSSTIVALMQVQSNVPVRTFTIGFEDAGFNEAQYAAAIARHLHTEHNEMYVKGSDALAVIQRLPSIYCEPFADSSQIPTFLVSQMARQQVKVVLSGDGADELFYGYRRYAVIAKMWKLSQVLPQPMRNVLISVLRTLPSSHWDKIFAVLRPLLPANLRVSMPGEKLHKMADILSLSDPLLFYQRAFSLWGDTKKILSDNSGMDVQQVDGVLWAGDDSFCRQMMASDIQTYMPDDVLVKVDRASMATGLETRAPMLDHRFVELAWRMPLCYKVRHGQSKWILRQVLYRYLPKSLIERPKMGFGVPLAEWLRGSLREWAANLLDETRLEQEGYFHVELVRSMWHEHLSGKKDWHHHLWAVLMFQAWLVEQ